MILCFVIPGDDNDAETIEMTVDEFSPCCIEEHIKPVRRGNQDHESIMRVVRTFPRI